MGVSLGFSSTPLGVLDCKFAFYGFKYSFSFNWLSD